MDNLSNLALLLQMLESAEKNLQSAKQLLREMMGGIPAAPVSSAISEKIKTLSISGTGKVIEGVFDGQNMMGPDGKKYPVPANYASKSKLVEGDVLKLTIADDGSFIYKQIGPVERAKKIGILMVDENGEYKVNVAGKPYKVLLASLTYFKAEPGDELTVVTPKDTASEWAAVENVVKKAGEMEAGGGSRSDSGSDLEQDLDLGGAEEGT